jgi:undecaprenyl-diphosphatase
LIGRREILRRIRRAQARVAPFVEQRTLVTLLLLSGFAWAFIALADEVVEGETHAFDSALLLALRSAGDTSDPLGPPWVEELARDVTALGGVGVLIFITLAVAVFLRLQGRRGDMLFVLFAAFGGQALSTLFKQGFARTRPDLVPHEVTVHTASFPSGHAMMAAVTYLTLGALLARVQPRRLLRIYLLGIATVLTFAVGVSRIYLGVHWPTDVLAGWTAGAAWALLCWTVARWLQCHGELPPAPPDDGGPGGR